MQLNRGGRRLGAKRLNLRCLARFYPRIVHSSTFRVLFRPRGASRPIRSRRLVVRL